MKSIVGGFLLVLLFQLPVHGRSEPFPTFLSIQPNVEFWIQVYATYTTRQGILHDSENLDVVYEVIDLADPEKPGARKLNQARIKLAKHKYVEILRGLARGSPPGTPEARRVARLFGGGSTPRTFREAADNIRCQVGQKDRFREGLIRSGAYLEDIREILQQNGLPTDLAYLPHVESSFNPAAYSKFGAAGIWQFTRSTGKRFMRVDYTVDDRRDPILASHAAAKLLKENHQKLGDWPLAVTAYNHGTNGMLRAKQAEGDYETIFQKYRGRLFRFASRNFYSEFLAACEVAKNREKYFGKLQLDRPARYPEKVLPGYADFRELARFYGVDPEAIRRLNPSLREPVFRGEKHIPKGFRLRLPLNTAYASAADIPENLIRSAQKRSQFYRVEKGDTAGKIARIHGVELKELILANNLDHRATLFPGQNLRIPALREPQKPPSREQKKETEPPDPPSPKPAEQQIAAVAPPPPEPPAKPQLVIGDLRVKGVDTQRGRPVGIIHVVVEETIGHYADWLQVSAREIRRLNGLPYGKVLKLNQKIRIPLEKISKEQFEEQRFEYHEEIVQDFFTAYRVDQVQVYHIQHGDNIWKLCRDVFEVPLWLFKTYNAGLDLNALKASQPVHIPVVEKVVSG